MYLPNNTSLQGGKYRIVRFISAGGFGNTYEGLHVMLNKRVAIKEFFVKDFCNRDDATALVTVGITSKTALVSKLKRKFIEEAQAVSMLKHPHIVNVHDVFEENGTAYYVMDYIEGSSLNEIVKSRGALSEEEATDYILQVADALRYVHSRNRLHLDVKPGNVMIDNDNNAMLIDFGASKQYDEEAGENTSTLLGKTPGYAPLEQMGNDVVKFTPSTDIYALGATFYKLLTGNTPPSATLLAIGSETIAMPAGISSHIADAVLKSMQTSKTARPQSIDEFVGLLTPPKPEPSRKSERVSRPKKHSSAFYIPKRYRGKLIAALCAMALVAIGGVVYLASSHATEQPLETEVADTICTVTDSTYKDADSRPFTYTGEVLNDKPNGKGTGVYPYGSYTGEYKDGLRHGKGTFETTKGENKYEGTFANDKYDEGKLTKSDGYYFVGKYKNNLPFNGSWFGKNGDLDRKVVDGNMITTGTINGHDWIDLGLPSGTKWATCNIGASSPDKYGYYLEPSKKDHAQSRWGKTWRVPTLAQFQEVVNNKYTIVKWTSVHGTNGLSITSRRNGNNIFLPAAGSLTGDFYNLVGESCCYFTATVAPPNFGDKYFWALSTNVVRSHKVDWLCIGNWCQYSIRPVSK